MPWMLSTLATGLAIAGCEEEARAVLAELEKRSTSEYGEPRSDRLSVRRRRVAGFASHVDNPWHRAGGRSAALWPLTI
jgi:hypothetical protein